MYDELKSENRNLRKQYSELKERIMAEARETEQKMKKMSEEIMEQISRVLGKQECKYEDGNLMRIDEDEPSKCMEERKKIDL